MIFLHFLKCFPRQCGGQPISQSYTPEVRVFPASAGGQPLTLQRARSHLAFSPPVRGSTCSIEEKKFAVKRFPRRCGGQPSLHLHDGDLLPFSPPVRGSALIKIATFICRFVFPASAGINLKVQDLYQSTSGFPRQCGGQPSLLPTTYAIAEFSPPVRGSTLAHCLAYSLINVFPASAGITLS